MRPFLNGVSGKSESDIIYLNGGLNTCNDQTEIQDNQLPYMYNLSLAKSPTLKTRSNRLSLAWRMNDRTGYGEKIIYKMFSASSNALYTIEEYDNSNCKVYAYTENNGIDKTYIGDVGAFGIVNGKVAPYSICECRDSNSSYIFISDLLTVYKYEEGIGGQYTTTTVDSGILAAHKNRLWVGWHNSVKFSNLQDFDNFTIDPLDPNNTAGEIQLTNAKGDIIGLISFDGKLIVLCERSWHIIYGSTPNQNLSDSFYVVDMNDSVGCCSRNGYAVVDRALYWMDKAFCVYRYNGASLLKISEPYGNDNYAQYGGIKNFVINRDRATEIVMSGYENYLYIGVTHLIKVGAMNDTFLVYDTRNRVWWLEDGGFYDIVNWEREGEDYFVGASYGCDLLWLNQNSYMSGKDILYDTKSSEFKEFPIQYDFETKTWLLNNVKHKKTLTNIWFQANAASTVYAHNSWTFHTPGEPDIQWLQIGHLFSSGVTDILHPNWAFPEGTERQRVIVPKMFLQKVNAFGIRVAGSGYAEFHLLEKEWRIK